MILKGRERILQSPSGFNIQSQGLCPHHLTGCICLQLMLFSEALVMELTGQNDAVMCPLPFIQVRFQRNDSFNYSIIHLLSAFKKK